MKVHLALFNDFETDAGKKVTALLNRDLPVLVYNGDKDFICNWEGGQLWTTNIDWKHGDDFRKQEMKKVGYGEKKTFKNFTFLRVYDAGHMVPMD